MTNLLAAILVALATVESDGNDHAVNGRSLGRYQLTPAFCAEASRISGHAYRHEDAFNPVKARRMVEIVLTRQCTAKNLGRNVMVKDVAGIFHHGLSGWLKYGETDDYESRCVCLLEDLSKKDLTGK